MGLMDSKNKVTIYTDVVPDPPITHVVKGIEFMEGIKPTVIIAIGGGSCIDMSKGIAYFGRKLKHMDIKSFIAVPTTSGTGSEVHTGTILRIEFTPGPFFCKQRVFLDLYTPTLIVGQMPVELIKFIQRHQI